MNKTEILLPVANNDNRKTAHKSKAQKLKKILEERDSTTLDEFLCNTNLDYKTYIDIRASLWQPTMLFQRNILISIKIFQ